MKAQMGISVFYSSFDGVWLSDLFFWQVGDDETLVNFIKQSTQQRGKGRREREREIIGSCLWKGYHLTQHKFEVW
jgi:hypothetical protein